MLDSLAKQIPLLILAPALPVFRLRLRPVKALPPSQVDRVGRSTLLAFEDRFGVPLIESLGLTETGSQITANPLPPMERKAGSAGIAWGNEVAIGDASAAGNGDEGFVAEGEEGKIWVRGENVTRGYLRAPDETRKAFTAGGWFRTGYLERMDGEGYVFVTGRIKELIIKGGENIAPREIDEALLSHGDVLEAAAFGMESARHGQFGFA